MVVERLGIDEFWRWPDHVARYLRAAEWVAGQRVLDAGTGIGYGAALLRASGAASVTGIDIDAAAIAAAQRNFPHDGLEFLQGDCETLQVAPGPFGVICSFENIEHLPHPERFLAAASKSLAPDGTLLISTPDRQIMPPFVHGKPANPYHVHEWYAEEFRELLAVHFTEIRWLVQIKSNRVRAGQRLHTMLARSLHSLFDNPLVRLGRVWQKLRGTPASWPDFEQLTQGVVAGPEDYPIVEPSLVPFLGQPWCHFAVCRGPRH